MGNKSSRPRSATAAPANVPRPAASGAATTTATAASSGGAASAAANRGRSSTAAMVVTALGNTSAAAVSRNAVSAGSTRAAASIDEGVAERDIMMLYSQHPVTHRPTGTVYPIKSCRWPFALLASLVTRKVIAPFEAGVDDPTALGAGVRAEECPLCMLHYTVGLNSCSLCHQGLCSDCFANLLEPPSAHKISKGEGSSCPFCNAAPFSPLYSGPKTAEQLAVVAAEQDKLRQMERAMLDAAIADEQARLERKRQGLPPLTPPMAPAAAAVAVVSPRASTPPPPTHQNDPDADLFELPQDVRRAILREQFRQHLVALYRFVRPDGVATVDTIVDRYGVEREDEVIATVVKKYGGVPPLQALQTDAVQRLSHYYWKKARRRMPATEAQEIVARFGAAPWKAMARAVVERGPEIDPPPVPEAVPATPPRQRSEQGGGTSVAAASPLSPYGTADDIRDQLPNEMRRQSMISIGRTARPALGAWLQDFLGSPALAANSFSDVHVQEVCVECGLTEDDAAGIGRPLRRDVDFRLRRYFSIVLPSRPVADVDMLLERYAGREITLMAGAVLKYGPEPLGAARLPEEADHPPRRPRRYPHDDETSIAILTALLPMDDIDVDLADALRASVVSATTEPPAAAPQRAPLPDTTDL